MTLTVDGAIGPRRPTTCIGLARADKTARNLSCCGRIARGLDTSMRKIVQDILASPVKRWRLSRHRAGAPRARGRSSVR
jgi:hypothetical protein